MKVIPKIGTLLFVDDEHHVTDALLRVMRLQPFELLSASSASRALEILETRHVDVVVSDEQMPGMPGSVFLGKVRRQFPNTIRIILSGQATLDAAVRAINEGEVYRFILKPCNPADLVATIRQALSYKRLELQSRRLLRNYQRQTALLARVQHDASALMQLDIDEEGAILMDESEAEGEIDGLVEQMQLAMQRTSA